MLAALEGGGAPFLSIRNSPLAAWSVLALFLPPLPPPLPPPAAAASRAGRGWEMPLTPASLASACRSSMLPPPLAPTISLASCSSSSSRTCAAVISKGAR